MEEKVVTQEFIKKKVTYDPFSGGPISKAVPTTEVQREIWASIVMDENATLCYNESAAILFQGPLNIQVLNLAYLEIQKKHDALRMIFSSDCKTFFVKEDSTLNITFHDYSEKTSADLEEFKQQEIQFKYDLINGPCHRVHLLKTNSDEHTLIFTAHHIVCDGWSLGILFKELSEYYEILKENHLVPEELGPQFADYAIYDFKRGINLDHKNYWFKEFERPLDTNNFPVDFKRPSFRTFNSRRHDVVVPDTLVAALKHLGARNGCSFYNVLMSLYNVFLYKLTKSEDIVVGMAAAGQAEDLEGNHQLVGHLVNLLPLRIQLSPELTFVECMKLVQAKMYKALDHQSYSYGQLVKDLNLPREADKMALLNSVFNIDVQPLNQGLNFSDVEASFVTIPREFENFELFFNAVNMGDSLILECQYNTNLFTTATLENWTSSILELMNLVVVEPQEKISNLKLNFLKISAITEDESISVTPTLVRNSYIEEKIKDIWTRVLLVPGINVEDNFFTIGGHSLLAIEVANLMTKEFNITFTIKDVFENPTILLLAQKIGNNIIPSKVMLPEMVATENTVGPVSPNQMQVWYLEQINAKTTMHNLPASIRIKSGLNVPALEKTLHTLIERHASFRTAINVEASAPVQKILSIDRPEFKPSLEVIRVKEEDLTKHMNIDVQTPFDLSKPPFIKAKLFQLADNDYVFFFVVHHMIWDGWSFDIFFEELDTIYSAYNRNQKPQFKKNPVVNVLDYSQWLHNLINDKILDNELNYWEEKLKGPLPILALPQDYKRPLEISHVGSTINFEIPQEKAQVLREFARINEQSLFNIFLTALKITLAKYSGIDDIIVGLPVRARNQPEIMQTIGYFVNTVALRTEISLNLSFEENLKKVTQTCLEAFEHQLAPFQLVLNKLNYTRDAGRTPIYQTFFAYQDVNNRNPELDGTPYTQVNVEGSSVNTDLDLWIKASKNKIEGGFAYRIDLFREISIERLMETFFHTLDDLVENFQKPLNITKSIPLNQEEKIISEWNNTWKTYEENTPFHLIFEKRAIETPYAIAIETSTDKVDYKTLNTLANRCANKLLTSGIGKGDLVGISLKRTPDLVAVILGVLKTGAGYVPLDPGFPQDRLDYMISNATPKILITEESLTERFTGAEPKLLVSQFIGDQNLDSAVVFKNISLDDAIYVIYTSGSTGNPKGVEITHGCVANFLLSMKEIIGCNKEDKLLAVTTLSFDIAVLELFLPLISGATIFLASSTDVMDGGVLKSTLENKNITIMQATPSTWRLLLASGWRGSKKLKILCGGEAFPIDLARKLIPICLDVWNMYGPTETTVWSACKRLTLDDDFITIGKPIANTSLYVLDQNRFMQPIGVTGELFIGGHGLSTGYFGREDLTSERFMTDPFMPGMRMYATGDLARYTYNGEVECLGRNDGQVKVRGYRIELGEIEAEIQRIPAVKEVAVVTKEIRPEDVRILAYVSSKDEAHALEERTLRELLGKKLPNYMLPSHFIFMKEIPKTLNGKIDKKSLPKFSLEVEEEITPVFKNDNGIEGAIRSMWMDVLGTKSIKDTDNFFDIGGNSLLAVDLFFRIKDKFKLNLPLAALLQADNFGMFVRDISEKINPSEAVNYNLPINVPTIFKSLIAIKTTGEKTPLFCFHGVGGNVLNYVTLVAATKNERPLYALQSIGLDGVTPLIDSIEEMAKNYIREMKIIQPEGPYLLAGGSMGGMIAYEVAIQLVNSGDNIEKLIMFDTFGPNLDLKAYSSNIPKPMFTRLKASIVRRVEGLLMKIKTTIFRSLGLQVPLKTLLVEIERKNYQALWKYFPKVVFKGNLHLIRSKSELTGWYSDPVMGWKDIIKGEIKTYEIEGTHENFIESSELITVIKKIL